MTSSLKKIQAEEISSILKKHANAFLMVAFLSFSINLLFLVPSIYMLQIYDRVLTSRSESTLIAISILVLGLYIFMGLLESARSSILIRVSNSLDDYLGKRTFSAAFERNLKETGNSAGQSLLDLTNLRQFFTGQGLFAFLDAPWFPLYLLVIFAFHPYLGYFSLLGALLLIIFTFFSEKLSKKLLEKAQVEGTIANHFANINLRNTEVIQAMGMLPNLLTRWSSIQSKMLLYQSFASDRAAVMVASTKFVRLALQSGVLGLGALLVIDGSITPGVMIAASILSGRALAPIEQLIGSWKNFQSTKFSYNRLSKLLYDYPVKQKGIKLPRPLGNYSADSIYVTPPKSIKSIIKGVSFNITAGEILGIIGPSGSGKTTLARALTGVWPCQLGTMRLDGAVIYDWDKAELGPAIGYLPQDIELLSGTVAENIARFCAPNSDLVIQAAKSVGIHELILKLPAGYETQVGEYGNALSGGERQRIGLARAIYAEPSVLVLDEPNSNLDERGEISLIKTILDAKSRGSTCVVITHRDQILKVVDKLLVLVDGEIKLMGPKDQVLIELSKLGNFGVS